MVTPMGQGALPMAICRYMSLAFTYSLSRRLPQMSERKVRMSAAMDWKVGDELDTQLAYHGIHGIDLTLTFMGGVTYQYKLWARHTQIHNDLRQ